MRHLKAFENYSVEEVGEKVFEEQCGDCNCTCENCDCDDCECTKCCKKCESIEIGKMYNYNNPKDSEDNGKSLRVLEVNGNKIIGNMNGKKIQTNIEFLTEKKKAKKEESTTGLTAKQKKLPAALQASILKRLGKKPKKDKEEDTDKKADKKVGLTAGQKKLPEAMQKAILAKQKK